MPAPDARYDALVIGGGVYGVLLALEGAARGQRILLVERDDFGAGASANHLRTIHGGLRYLQSLDIRRALSSNRQRLWWLRNFPDLVEPIRCLMPLHNEGLRRRSAFRLGFALARALGLDRSTVAETGRMELVSDAEIRRSIPNCRRDRLVGGAAWYDAFMPKPHRIIAELLHWADYAGAELRNRTEFVSGRREADGNWIAELADHGLGTSVSIRAGALINASGAAADEVLARLPTQPSCDFVPVLAWGLLVDRPPVAECSIGVSAGAGRPTWFLHPYHGKVLAGIGLAGGSAANANAHAVTNSHIDASLAELNAALPGMHLARRDIEHVFAGKLPGITRGSDQLLRYPRIIDHAARDGLPGAWTVLGVKFTEAPAVADQFWNGRLGRRAGDLPARPDPVAVPSVADARSMSDDALRESLDSIAAAEWVCETEDILRRRSDLWMDKEQSKRVAALLGRDGSIL